MASRVMFTEGQRSQDRLGKTFIQEPGVAKTVIKILTFLVAAITLFVAVGHILTILSMFSASNYTFLMYITNGLSLLSAIFSVYALSRKMFITSLAFSSVYFLLLLYQSVLWLFRV